ncbi:MAG TPA: tetratricopeptide repeat protein [Acetobacteraceae bacterium]|nr:tetratricopeptide repeat protein [Acetobacteraceae bacterium]
MHRDAHGLEVTVASGAAVQAFDHALAGYLSYRADMPQRMTALLEADPEFGLAHCLKGYLTMLAYKQAAVPIAAVAAADAARLTAQATPRERAHVAALRRWIDGEPDRAADIWEQILAEHPRDILAFRLAHFINFWLGRPEVMLASVHRVERHWGEELPGYGAILGCRCFAHEECGHYTEAEAAGRAAIDRDPGDLWAAHGVAHVLEMQGRRGEGIAWIDSLRGNWDEANNLRHHLWWHAAMFRLERGEMDRVLALYDGEFRNLNSRLTEALPDLYIDVQNAASMLFRLQRHGVDVGNRWEELADRAEARIGDCLSAFTLPHWMMALVATGRHEAAHRMLEAMRAFTQNPGLTATLVARYALPICEAVLAHGRGEFVRAVEAMHPVLGGMYRLGGSHAQQDVLEQLYLDSAMQAGLHDDARLLLERVAGRHPLPPQRRIGYAAAARAVGL